MSMTGFWVKTILLDCIEPEKKLLYGKSHIEKLYLEYHESMCDVKQDWQRSKEELERKTLLILDPGSTIISEKDKTQSVTSNVTDI